MTISKRRIKNKAKRLSVHISPPAGRQVQRGAAHEDHHGCMTLRILGCRIDNAKADYLEKFGTLPHAWTMRFLGSWGEADALERAVTTNTPIEPSADGIEFESLCKEYRIRFGHEVIPESLWLFASPETVVTLIKEALVLGRRRWALECGDMLEGTDEIFIAAGLSPENVSLEDLLHIWLEPLEWLRPKV